VSEVQRGAHLFEHPFGVGGPTGPLGLPEFSILVAM
jgi:hypothetical protein